MRRRLKTQWMWLTVFITVSFSGTFLLRGNHVREFQSNRTTGRTTESSFSLASMKHVTKSLAELGKMDDVNRHFLFLNHVPKCGSEILILLLQKLQGSNNYRHVRLTGGNKRYLMRSQQEALVFEMYDIIRKEAIPLSFDRHVYFINFTKFDRQLPTYINLIRDPVDKILSRTSYNDRLGKKDFYSKCLMRKKNNCNFKNGKTYDLTIPYFCGHDPRCMMLNNDWALQTAKANVEKYYPVVGVLEELNVTLEILEYKIPYFFKGIQDLYKKDLLKVYRNKKKPKILKIVQKKLKETLVKEYEFYEWIKSRLFRQLQIMYGDHNSH
ncbi:uronyl 2-sulfotransferase-like [Anoplophora glabripennis]|uniref:uronyl 2-sulfotransferase-like n=1 Tax=Anoplophora glabripennis TaxID=217634 RepID=UPI00087519FE|nr:uronyl 2-sulfotransferase-like [Anoplophora glabripennis]